MTRKGEQNIMQVVAVVPFMYLISQKIIKSNDNGYPFIVENKYCISIVMLILHSTSQMSWWMNCEQDDVDS